MTGPCSGAINHAKIAAMRRRSQTAFVLVAVLVACVAGCAGSGSNGGSDQASNAFKLASLDQGSDAGTDVVADYQDKLDQLDTYCQEDEAQLTRMVYAGSSKLTEDGAPSSNLGFMQAVLTALSIETPNRNEDCVAAFALTLDAVRADGGTG